MCTSTCLKQNVVRYNSKTIMLKELRRITSTEPYKSDGGMRMKEILITPWDTPNAKFLFEIWTDDNEGTVPEMWEVICNDLAQTDRIPQSIIPRTQLELFVNHPVLWHLDDKVFFSISSKADNIPELMGELFIEHTKACGNWVDFQWLYSSLPTTLETLRENQLAIPVQLKSSCFDVLKKHGVKYQVNTIQENDKGYKFLFFSNPEIWPNEVNFKQSYIIAKEFSETRLS
jgi:hypothetical protein